MMVSALMVTQPGREAFAEVATRAYAEQDYPSVELIHVMDDGRPLGALRNESVAMATGDLVIIWDDDDVHHPTRISEMVKALGDADMAFLERVTLRCHCGAICISRRRQWECTMIARRSAMAEYPADMEVAEDYSLVRSMARSGRTRNLLDSPHLYVKVDHGGNTINHRGIIKRGGHKC